MLLVGNGYLISHDETNPFIENGCVCIDGEIIIEIGKTASLRNKYPSAEFIDAKEGLIMPGLINTHHHIYSAFARGAHMPGPSPQNFLEILQNMWWKIDRLLTPLDIKYSAYWTYLDCIKNGVTTIFDHHASYGAIPDSLFTIGNVAEELGIRTSLCYEVSDREGKEKMKAAVKENVDFIHATQSHKHQKGLFGLHASFTLSDETLDYCQSHLPDGVGYHIHVAEDLLDVHESLKKYGKSVVHRLYDMNLLGPHTLAGHCIHITPTEIKLLQDTDTIVIHNPESNMGNAVGCPPVLSQFKSGILLGLGTDGYTSDLFESLKVANLLHKHHTCNPSVGWSEIPTMLFKHNAEIANRFFDTPVGLLRPGYSADVIIAEYIPQTPLNATNYASHLLFGVNGRCITHTMSSGKFLMKNREILVADEKTLMAKSRELATDLWNKF